MEIEEQFNQIAQEYDANRRKFIPCFDDYYENTTKLIAASIEKPTRILDLGAGTGLLSYYWYRQYPSALSIHHLEDSQKAELFARVYEKLPDGGLFVNYDQFCGESEMINEWYNTYWQQQLYHSGLTEQDLALWQERRKLDRECSVQDEIQMLHQCQFRAVQCVYSYHKFSVIAAVK